MEQTINQVKGGLYLDCDPTDQPKETYRDSVNGEIFETSKGKFIWRTKKGQKLAFTITNDMTPNGAFGSLDKIIVTSWSTNGFSEIGYVDLDEVNGYNYYPVYVSKDLGFDADHPIKGICNVENSWTERCYWLDHKASPRVLNILWITTGIKSAPYFNSLEADTRYMLVNNATFLYSHPSIGTISVSKGDWFRVIDTINVDPDVYHFVKYIPPELLAWTPDCLPSELKFSKIITGTIKYGSYFFTHRLGSNNGYNTPWQKIVGPINAMFVDPKVWVQGYGGEYYADVYQKCTGGSHLDSSNIGFELKLSGVDTRYDYIEVAYFHADQMDLATNGFITIKQQINQQSSFTFQLKKLDTIGTIVVSDVIVKNVSIEDINDLDILKNRMNIGGVVESRELPIGQKIDGVQITPELYSFCLDNRGWANYIPAEPGNGILEDEDPPVAIHSAIPKRDPITGLISVIEVGQHYKVFGSTGSLLTYNGYDYSPGQIFIGVFQIPTWSSRTGAYPKPTMVVRKYVDHSQQIIGGGNAINPSVYESIDLDVAYDYKDPVMNLMGKGYWGNQYYRFALIGWDNKMNPMFARFIGDILTPDRIEEEMVRSGIKSDGKQAEYYYNQPATNGEFHQNRITDTFNDHEAIHKTSWQGNILSMVIDNLDLTDIIDEISAFSIVRCPREKTILSEGWLEPIQYRVRDLTGLNPEFGYARYRWKYVSYREKDSWSHTRQKNWYAYIDPEQLFEKTEEQKIITDDRLRLARYMIPSKREVQDQFANYYLKHYVTMQQNNFDAGATKYGYSSKIVRSANADTSRFEKVFFDPEHSFWFFVNVDGVASQTSYYSDARSACVGGKARLIKTEEDGGSYGFGNWKPMRFYTDNGVTYDEWWNQEIPIVQHLRGTDSEYGGTSEYSVGASQFIFTNHFQIVDQAFKDALKTVNGRKYADGIQIFGGDCFVNIFDYKRMYIDYYVKDNYFSGTDWHNGTPLVNSSQTTEDYYTNRIMGQSVLIPLQSESNIALRTDIHIAKNRSRGATGNPGTGLNYDDKDTSIELREFWEHYLYDDSFSSTHCELKYPAYPQNFIAEYIFWERIRYSLKKVVNEVIDSFRIFKGENKVELNKRGGPISNIIGDKDRLFYWQNLVCGYIPIGERQMDVTEMGAPIQLGIGGEYQIIDDISKFYGCQHRFGVLKTPLGFVWYDAMRKKWIHMDMQSGISEDSLIEGMSNKFEELSDRLPYTDNIAKWSGLALLYSPSENLVYGTFCERDHGQIITAFTIAYNVVLKKFVSFFTDWPTVFAVVGNNLFSSANHKNFYVYNKGNSREFHGIKCFSSIKFVITGVPLKKTTIAVVEPGQNMCFYLMAQLVNTNAFFDKVIYQTLTQLVNEFVVQHPQNYQSAMGEKWEFNFPQTNTGRLFGLYLELTLMNYLEKEEEAQVKEVKTFFSIIK